jgi:hypothetical protein
MIQKEIRTFADKWLDEVTNKVTKEATKANSIEIALQLYDDGLYDRKKILKMTKLSEDEFQAALAARDEVSKTG